MHGNGVLNHKKALEDMLNNKIKRGYPLKGSKVAVYP